jgi:hypothetical protein
LTVSRKDGGNPHKTIIINGHNRITGLMPHDLYSYTMKSVDKAIIHLPSPKK